MPKRLTQREVIRIVHDVHGDLYDTSKLIYKNSKTKFILICPEHGEFTTTLGQVVRGQRCYTCGKTAAAKKRRNSFEKFIESAKKIHGDLYEYDKGSYLKASEKVRIKCKNHGWFNQLAKAHIDQEQGCPDCGDERVGESKRMSAKEYLSRVKKEHKNRYSYPNFKYKNQKSKIKVVCPDHGTFETNAGNHLNGSGCPLCGVESGHELQRKDIEEFINDSRKAHGDKYDYSKVVYKGGKVKVKIICLRHGAFMQSPNHHQRGAGCPGCNESRGERLVKKILEEMNVDFVQQKKFKGLKDRGLLKCDFYLSEYNLVIEFNGEQHYKPKELYGGEKAFKSLKRRDQLKRDYFKKYNIGLLEIRYDNKDVFGTIERCLNKLSNGLH